MTLVAILKKYWLHMAIAVAVLAYTGFIYYQGGRAPRAELAERIAQDKELAAEREAEDAADLAESIEDNTKRDAQHEADLKGVAALWRAELGRVQHDASATTPTRQSVPITPKVCNDEAGNRRLSDALATYRSTVGDVLEKLEADDRARRADVAGLLAKCHVEASDYSDAVDGIQHLQELWTPESR